MEKRRDDYKRYYTNSTGLEVTSVDISLCVNYKDDEDIEELCKIIFSPEQAKLTMLMLKKALEEYEKDNRKIEIDENSIGKIKGENKDGEKGK